MKKKPNKNGIKISRRLIPDATKDLPQTDETARAEKPTASAESAENAVITGKHCAKVNTIPEITAAEDAFLPFSVKNMP